MCCLDIGDRVAQQRAHRRERLEVGSGLERAPLDDPEQRRVEPAPISAHSRLYVHVRR